MIERKMLKEKAKVQLKGNIGILFLCSLITGLIIGLVSLIPYVGTLAAIVVGSPFAISLYLIYLGITYGEKPRVEDIFKGFSAEYFGRSVVTSLLVSLFSFLWTLLFIIPGIIKSYSYSMTFYILAENPQMSATEAITESRRLMNGHKMEYFILNLSFIPWILLTLVTFGVAAIYVAPYISLTTTNFYQELKLNSTKTIGEV